MIIFVNERSTISKSRKINEPNCYSLIQQYLECWTPSGAYKSWRSYFQWNFVCLSVCKTILLLNGIKSSLFTLLPLRNVSGNTYAGLSLLLCAGHLGNLCIYMCLMLLFIARAAFWSGRSNFLWNMLFNMTTFICNPLIWEIRRRIRPWSSLCRNNNFQRGIYHPSAHKPKCPIR